MGSTHSGTSRNPGGGRRDDGRPAQGRAKPQAAKKRRGEAVQAPSLDEQRQRGEVGRDLNDLPRKR